MCLAQGPQRSDAGEARTRGPLVSSQALYHWATVLPQVHCVCAPELSLYNTSDFHKAIINMESLWMENCVDPDQLALSEASWSESTLFSEGTECLTGKKQLL